MTQYQGNVQSYVLEIQSPNSPYNQKGVISLHGAFGLAILYFVPQDGQLGKNQKRAGQDIFDVYYWMDSWPHFTDLLRNEKPVQFQYDDSNNTAQVRTVRANVPGASKRFAERFIKAHLLSRVPSDSSSWSTSRPPRRLASKFILNGSPASTTDRVNGVTVRFWHLADIRGTPANVRAIGGKSGHDFLRRKCLLLTQSGHDPYAASTLGFEKPIGIGSKVVFNRYGLGRVALLSGIAYLVLSTLSASEDADVTSGQLLFNNACRTCHSIREGENRLGPHMRGIIGRKAGSLPNYSFSSAMKGANFVWDEKNLERFIANPDETVPGNTMKPYGGLASAESRVKLIAFLKTLAADQ